MKNYKVILIIFLLGITIFSVFKYVSSLKTLNILDHLKVQVAALEDERQDLLQTLEKERELQQKFKVDLEASEEKLINLNEELTQAQKTIEELNSQVSTLKAENASFIKEKNDLSAQLTQIIREKDEFKRRLSSISELKKAIRELKRQMHQVSREIKRKTRPQTKKIIEGNRGFLIKDGKSTYIPRVKIEVKPVP